MILRRLGTAAVAATLAAGVVGAWRQRRESRAPGPPRRPAELDDAEALGPVGRHLATWVPERPRTPLGRAAATAWAAPLSVLGVVLGLASGASPRWDPDRGCLVFEGARGPAGAALEAVGARANAIGQVVLVRRGTEAERLIDHEAVHVRQAERLGPLLFPTYLWLAARYGYADHPLERAARTGGRAKRTGRREVDRPSGRC